MKRKNALFPALLTIAMLAGGCASSPPERPAAPALAVTDCDRLAAEIARAEQNRQAGLEKEKNAWKVIVPFAVAARYVSGKSLAEQSGRQVESLRAEYDRKGCVGHGA